MNPSVVAMTGMKPGTAKKTRRGRKPSGKPGAQHLAALQQAHGAGNFKAAKTHALNYAKAVHAGGMAEPDADEMGGPSDMDADNATPATTPAPPKPNAAGMSMARMAFAKRKK